MIKNLHNARRPLAALSAVALAVGVAACGNKTNHPTTEPFVDGSASSGFYVDAGRPAVTYQVQESRALNPYSTEDKAYIRGVAPADATLSPSQEWLLVSLWAKNQSHISTITASTFTLSDADGNVYHPIALNTAENAIAWAPQLLRPQQTEPMADTPASTDATQGGELLFKIDDSVYANRPLLLNIYAKGQAKPSQISLDL